MGWGLDVMLYASKKKNKKFKKDDILSEKEYDNFMKGKKYVGYGFYKKKKR